MKYLSKIGGFIFDFFIAISLIAGVTWMANKIQTLNNIVENNKEERNHLIDQLRDQTHKMDIGMSETADRTNEKIQKLENRIDNLEAELNKTKNKSK